MDNPTTAGVVYDKASSPGLWEKRLVAGIYNYFEIDSRDFLILYYNYEHHNIEATRDELCRLRQ